MIEDLWKTAGIELRYQDYQHPVYGQSGGDFVSHLSVVDALMFEGQAEKRFVGISVPK